MTQTPEEKIISRWKQWAGVIKCNHPNCIQAAINLADMEQESIFLRLETIKSIHVKVLFYSESGYACAVCNVNWPCSTIRELEKIK